MVISAWPDGVAGLLLARVTMTAPGGTLSVRAAKGSRELARGRRRVADRHGRGMTVTDFLGQFMGHEALDTYVLPRASSKERSRTCHGLDEGVSG